MKKTFWIYCSLLLNLLIAISCNSESSKEIAEGTIEYNAVCIDQSNSLANMAPTKMTMKFKNNKTAIQMNAGMGLFSTSFISNSNTKTLTQVVKLLNKKFATVLNENEIKNENAEFDFDIQPLNDTKLIAGIVCKKANVTSRSGAFSTFDIFYTSTLKSKNPNFANPFNTKGVLLGMV